MDNEKHKQMTLQANSTIFIIRCYLPQSSTRLKNLIVYFTTRGHLFLKISRFILEVEQPYFACSSESICPNWGFNLGFCSSAVKKFCKKSLLKICIFCELDF